MSIVLTPETSLKTSSSYPRLFLAGSIEMGKAELWQDEAIGFFSAAMPSATDPLVIYNPRCENFGPKLEQSITNDRFNHQVTWELQNLQGADAVIMYLQAGTNSPISLLELGLLAGLQASGSLNKLVVCCPDGFYRQGNVDIVSKMFNIKVVRTKLEMYTEGLHILQRNHDRRMTKLRT